MKTHQRQNSWARFAVAATVVAAMSCLWVPSAQAYVIDDFLGGTITLSDTSVAGGSSQVNAGNAGSLTGTRDVFLEKLGSGSLASISESMGILSLSTGSTSGSQAIIQWDGADMAAPTVFSVTSGFPADLSVLMPMGVDITDGGLSTKLLIPVLSNDVGGATLRLTLWTTRSSASFYSVDLMISMSPVVYAVSLTSLPTSGEMGVTSGAVFTAIRAATLEIYLPEAGFLDLGPIQTAAVPEPTTLGMGALLIGLVFGASRYRRQRVGK